MSEAESSFDEWFCRATDGTELFFRSARPAAQPGAVLCLVHGHGDHCGMYGDAMRLLAARGFAVCGFDLRGHGRSGGPRGDSPSYEQLMDDVALLLSQTVERFGGDAPRFLFGHSHGGGLVINYALRRRPVLNGVIATSPWLKLAFRPSPVMSLLAHVLRVVRPGLGVSPKDERRLPDMVGTGRPKPRDEMVHRVITPRLFFSTREANEWALRNAARFPLPLLVIHGEADRATSIDASRAFAAAVPGDATFLPLAGMRHLIHVEGVEEPLFEHVAAWMRAHLNRQPSSTP